VARDRPKESPSGLKTLADIVAIKYRLALQNPNNSAVSENKVYAIYRSVLDARTTFEKLKVLGVSGVQDLFRDEDNTPADAEDILGIHLTSFEATVTVECAASPQGVTRYVVPLSAGVRAGGQITAGDGSALANSAAAGGKLLYLDVTLCVLNKDGFRRLAQTNYALPPGFSSMREYSRQYGHCFSQRLSFP
jgi:hypothetical protein